MAVGALVNVLLVAVVAVVLGIVDGQNCALLSSKCDCQPSNPKVVLVLLDVSRSIDVDLLWTKYKPAADLLGCGLYLGEENNMAGRDAIGFITFGWDQKVNVPLKRYTLENWWRSMTTLTRDHFQTRYWAKKCCTSLAEALDMARKEIFAANEEGRIDVDNSDVIIHILTDGYPVQNRFRGSKAQKYGYWTQEKYYPSKYELQLVPEKAKLLKDLYGATINTFFLDNRKGLTQNEAENYFRGIGLIPESSNKRKAYKSAFIAKGPARTFGPRDFPIVSTPTANHVADVTSVNGYIAMVNQQVDYLCPTTQVPVSRSCTKTPAPVPVVTKTPTKQPTPVPVLTPTTKTPTRNPTTGTPTTPGPTPPPTRLVETCGGEKDLIFILDSSNSIADSPDYLRFKNNVLPLAQDLQRIQQDGQANYRTAVITFSKVIKVRVPLAEYTYAQFGTKIEELRTDTSLYMGCCTTTAEAMDLAADMLNSRSLKQDAIVLIITDGKPMINKSPYEGAESGTQAKQYRRPGDCGLAGAPANCVEMTYAEYRSRQVFESATALKNTGNTKVFLVGVPDKRGNPTQVEYFTGQEEGDACETTLNGQNQLDCKTCSGKCNANNDCWATQAGDKTCGAFSSPIVSDPPNEHAISSGASFDLDSLVQQLRDLLCTQSPAP